MIQVTLQDNPGGGALLVLSGELNIAAGKLYEIEEVAGIIEQENGPDVHLDLNDVREIDSSGLGQIIHLYKMLRRRGRTLAAVVPRRFESLFEMCRLDKIISLEIAAD